jgi:predicted dehydrogenase
MKKKLNIGLIGRKFMGQAHNHAYTVVDHFFDLPVIPVKKVLCGRGPDVQHTAERWGWSEWTTSWEEVVSRDDIDIIDISAPSTIHKDVAIAAFRNRKHVLCEKPLALSLEDAREMLEEAKKSGMRHSVGFNYRKVPALSLAKQLIDDGKIGKIFHFRGIYSQDWLVDPEFPLAWRLRKKDAGGGSSWDLGAHVVDLARFLVGEVKEVVGVHETFIKERPVAEKEDGLTAIAGKTKGKVDVDDATAFLARFESGALGLFEMTRFATGRKNQNQIQVMGSKGSFVFNMERMNELEYYSQDEETKVQGFHTIQVTDSTHPYVANYWPSGHIIGFAESFVNEVYDFLMAVTENRDAQPSFTDGLKAQEILDAVDRSIAGRSWISL